MLKFIRLFVLTVFFYLPIYPKSPYDELKSILPLDMHGWFCSANEKHLKRFILEKKPQIVVEVGVWLGKSAIFMALLLPEGARLYAIDHWKGQYYWQNPGADITSRMPMLYEQFLSNVIHNKLTYVIEPIRMPSLHAAQELDIQADLIYIDASHMADDVFNDIIAWYPKLKDGGLMCGDDWWSESVKKGVKRAATILKKEIKYEENFWFF